MKWGVRTNYVGGLTNHAGKDLTLMGGLTDDVGKD